MKKKEQRLNDIMALVREQPPISIKELAKILDVSEMTIRRDISYLKESNAMTQMLGMNVISAAPAQPPLMYDFQYELERNVEAKERIARKASNLIRPRAVSYTHLDVYKRQGWCLICMREN